VALINQRTQELLSSQNEAVLRLNQRDEEISEQVIEIQLKNAAFELDYSNKLKTTNTYL